MSVYFEYLVRRDAAALSRVPYFRLKSFSDEILSVVKHDSTRECVHAEEIGSGCEPSCLGRRYPGLGNNAFDVSVSDDDSTVV